MGKLKVPMHSDSAFCEDSFAKALEDGGNKYGPYNWREEKISISVYYAAFQRHMDAYWDGENIAEDSGVHHVAHAMACCALILDADSVGMLIDDRPPPGATPELLKTLVTGDIPDAAAQPSFLVRAYRRVHRLLHGD
jgi:hypothetical protein